MLWPLHDQNTTFEKEKGPKRKNEDEAITFFGILTESYILLGCSWAATKIVYEVHHHISLCWQDEWEWVSITRELPKLRLTTKTNYNLTVQHNTTLPIKRVCYTPMHLIEGTRNHKLGLGSICLLRVIKFYEDHNDWFISYS